MQILPSAKELHQFSEAQEAFVQKERKIAEAQVLSVRLFTATISAAIVLLFLSYLAIHREMKRSGNAELLLNDTEADNRMRHAQTIGDAAGRMARRSGRQRNGIRDSKPASGGQ